MLSYNYNHYVLSIYTEFSVSARVVGHYYCQVIQLPLHVAFRHDYKCSYLMCIINSYDNHYHAKSPIPGLPDFYHMPLPQHRFPE